MINYRVLLPVQPGIMKIIQLMNAIIVLINYPTLNNAAIKIQQIQL